MAKNRIPIPDEISAKILFESDRTCCVCNHKSKPVQIHHIDEDPSNNSEENLSVLCLHCHDDTMIKGGFGRKLNATQVLLYKAEWCTRVKRRKEKADELASISTVTGSTETIVYMPAEEIRSKLSNNENNLLVEYLQKIVVIKGFKLAEAQTKFDTGITQKMNEGAYEMIDFYEEILNELAQYYPNSHFSPDTAESFFNKEVKSRFRYHGLIYEHHGVGTGGTIVSTMIAGSVMEDLNSMVIDIVSTLLIDHDYDDKLDFINWKAKWKK